MLAKDCFTSAIRTMRIYDPQRDKSDAQHLLGLPLLAIDNLQPWPPAWRLVIRTPSLITNIPRQSFGNTQHYASRNSSSATEALPAVEY